MGILLGAVYSHTNLKNQNNEKTESEREFYIEWLSMGKSNKSYYEKMNDEELEKEYFKMVEEKSNFEC